MILDENFLANRYWNANGYAACVVAVRGGNRDWTAYISGYDPESEQEAVNFTMLKGVKLAKQDAIALFPPEIWWFSQELTYRE